MGFSTPPSSGGGTSGLFGSLLTGTPPTQASTGFTNWLNQGTATVSNTAAGVTIADAGSAGPNRALYFTAPSASYKATALIGVTSDPNTYHGAGIGWRDSVSGKIEWMFMSQAANSGGQFVTQQLADINTYHSNLNFSYYSNYPSYPYWIQIQDNGTNVSYGYSLDGVNFTVQYNAAKAGSYLGGAGYNQLIFIAYVGGNINNPSSPGYASLMSWSVA
jgi:hypothetical protein